VAARSRRVGRSKRGARRQVGRALLALPTVAAVTVVDPLSTPPVGALAQDPWKCEDRTIDWYFSSAWDGYPSARGWAREAIGLWNQPLDYNGSTLVDVEEKSDSGGGSNTLVNLQYHEEIYGYSDCPPLVGAFLWLNSDFVGSRDFVRRVAKHEIGHLLGAEHSGAKDSNNGDDPPIMATCLSPSSFHTTNILTQDDYAYLNWLWSSTSNRQITANWGFEQGTSFWGFWNSGSSSYGHVTTGGATGPAYVRHKNVATSVGGSYLYQTIELANGDDNESYRVVGNYKVESGNAQDTGVSVALLRQNLNHSDSSNGCDYADGLVNLNDPTPDTYSQYGDNMNGWIMDTSKVLWDVSSTNWTWFGSPWVNPPSAEGYRLQVLVAAHVNSDSWVDFDNVRIEGT